MLEDFIESNNLAAKILPYAAKGRLVKCRLFICGKSYALAVAFASERISREKLKAALKADSVEIADSVAVEDVTGYNSEFLPPISIYGVAVVLDQKAAEAEKLRCLVSDERTLEITPVEIAETNEGCITADICE
ncbi:MAG: hypothetical protein JW744_01020 [Candidatus Diapherotrites archaeon]|uniref:YbaK/aminoacyl-tRNA synthetase-associated domain-containing protein n=1 Tax=Candidatus Iainarchaeum sp. TaxID=3101447 RepID=A0A938YMQ4_9ARCH|nr:hypothetical protein [Candidatus Diapherotrites archaeon]